MLTRCDGHILEPDAQTGGGARRNSPSVFQVMPRNMYFGASRATSIDLCVRDLVCASRFQTATRIFAEQIDDSFSGFSVDHLPKTRRAATFARANHVARAALRDTPDLIIVQQHLPTAIAIARRLPHAKIVLHTHNFQKAYNTGGGVKDVVHRVLRKRRYRHLAGIIHVSEACARHFTETWPEIAIPSAVIGNGLDFDAWRPAHERSKQILYVGRCAPEKGVLEAAQAAAMVLPQFPDWQVRFILSNIEVHPDYFRSVRMALSSLGPQAGIEVQRPFIEIKAAFERAAIALVPSKWIEPFGRTALEAHAGGAAVISSGTGGLAEISGNAALILPAVTPAAIAEAIAALIRTDALREQFARRGSKRARIYFDVSIQAARLDAFCVGVIPGDAV